MPNTRMALSTTHRLSYSALAAVAREVLVNGAFEAQLICLIDSCERQRLDPTRAHQD